MSKRLLFVLGIVLLWWTAYALMFASQVVGMGEEQGAPVSWREALRYSFGGWMTWVPLSLGLYLAVRRFPLERGRFFASAAALTLAALLVVVLRAAHVYYTNPLFGWYAQLPDFGSVLAASLSKNFMMAWTVIGAAHALFFYEKARERERHVADLERGLTAARLEALRAQLHPHFLFNALNSVAEMVHEDAELADRMLVSLSALLRDALSLEREQERPLRRELELLRHYLTIEKIRLGERLRIDWSVPEACLDVPVPALILQPLVENAIVHALARRREPGVLSLSASRCDGLLQLRVENSLAPGEPPAPGFGLGLRSVESRLQLLYGGRARFERQEIGRERHVVAIGIPLPVAAPGVAGLAA